MPYFDAEGPVNTSEVASIALEEAERRGIAHIVVATTTGATPKLFAGRPGVNVVAVSHAFGFKEKGKNSLTDEARRELTEVGIRVHTATHSLSGVERGLSAPAGGLFPAEIVAYTLKFFGAGTKVAVEVATSALDAGLIPADVPVIAVGGTKSGADTAIVIVPANSNRILETRVQEILAKPR